MYLQTGKNTKWAEDFILCLFLKLYIGIIWQSYFPLDGIS